MIYLFLFRLVSFDAKIEVRIKAFQNVDVGGGKLTDQ